MNRVLMLALLLTLPVTACSDGGSETGATDAVSGDVGSQDTHTAADTSGVANDTSAPNDTTASPDTGATVDTAAPTDTGDPTPVVYTANAGPYPVSPGGEQTLCVNVALDNPAPARVRAIHTRLSAGSHHMIISRVQTPGPVGTVEPCSPFDGGATGADTLFIAEKREASMIYPAGAALEIVANQQIRIEVHFFNYFPDDIDVTGAVDFELVPPSAGVTARADLLFNGPLGLYIPAQSTFTKTYFTQLPAGAHVFAMTSHTHRLGTRATLHRATSESAVGELLHESLDWSDPPLDQFDPPLTFAPGEGLLLTCEFHNTTDQAVTFGLSATDEMCFLWAHYFIPVGP